MVHIIWFRKNFTTFRVNQPADSKTQEIEENLSKVRADVHHEWIDIN